MTTLPSLKGKFLECTLPNRNKVLVPFWNADPAGIAKSLSETGVKPDGSDFAPAHFEDGFKIYFDPALGDPAACAARLENDVEGVRVDLKTLREAVEGSGVFVATAYIFTESLQAVNDSPHIAALRPMREDSKVRLGLVSVINELHNMMAYAPCDWDRFPGGATEVHVAAIYALAASGKVEIEKRPGKSHAGAYKPEYWRLKPVIV